MSTLILLVLLASLLTMATSLLVSMVAMLARIRFINEKGPQYGYRLYSYPEREISHGQMWLTALAMDRRNTLTDIGIN